MAHPANEGSGEKAVACAARRSREANLLMPCLVLWRCFCGLLEGRSPAKAKLLGVVVGCSSSLPVASYLESVPLTTVFLEFVLGVATNNDVVRET